jgi:type VI protein secretion system component VasF
MEQFPELPQLLYDNLKQRRDAPHQAPTNNWRKTYNRKRSGLPFWWSLILGGFIGAGLTWLLY